MRRYRNLTLSTHGAIELPVGILTMLAPVIFGFGAAGIVVSFALGSLLIGVALPLISSRDAIVGWHQGFDSLIPLAAAVSALVLALTGDRAAATFLAVLVALQCGLGASTRYAAA